MNRKKKITIGLLGVIIGTVFLFLQPEWYQRILSELQRVGQTIQQEFGEDAKIITPPPLRSKLQTQGAPLTIAGVIQWTNDARIKNGLPALKENILLNRSARVKADDMFAKQYFEHVSPSGVGVSDLAKDQGYDYITIGENLAVGNFKNDQDLVQAWMDSPGHRANILNNRYRDIGVSVVKGTFEGHIVWMAVQHFGLAIDTCPQIDSSLKNVLNANNTQLDSMLVQLDSLKAQLETMKKRDRDEYNQKVDEYNALANRYNELLIQTKNLTEKYNSQVDAFNKCVAG